MGVPLDIFAVKLGLELFLSERLFSYAAFVHKLINDKLSRPEILRKINFKISTFSSRNNSYLSVPQCLTNIIERSPEYRLLDACKQCIEL